MEIYLDMIFYEIKCVLEVIKQSNLCVIEHKGILLTRVQGKPKINCKSR